jgi:hypothetical protein
MAGWSTGRLAGILPQALMPRTLADQHRNGSINPQIKVEALHLLLKFGANKHYWSEFASDAEECGLDCHAPRLSNNLVRSKQNVRCETLQIQSYRLTEA